jgi:hypothetical protein
MLLNTSLRGRRLPFLRLLPCILLVDTLLVALPRSSAKKGSKRTK